MLSFTLLLIGSLLFATLAEGLVYHNSHLLDSLIYSLEEYPGKAVPSRTLEESPSLHRSLWHQLKPGVYQAEPTTRVTVISITPEATGATSGFPNPTPAPQITEGPTSRSSVTSIPRESGQISEKSLAPSPSSFSFRRHGDQVLPSRSISTIATLAAPNARPTNSTTTPQVVQTKSILVSSLQTPVDVSVTSDTVVSQTSSSSASVSYSETSNSGTSSTVSSGTSTHNGTQRSTPYPTTSSKSSNVTTIPLGPSSSMAPQRANGTQIHHAPFPSSSLTVPPTNFTAVLGFNPSSAKQLGHSATPVASKSQDPAASSTFRPNFSHPPSPAFVSIRPSSSEMHISSTSTVRSQSVASATAAIIPNPASSKTGLSSGGVIGIVIGVALLLSVLSGLLFYFCRRSPYTQRDVAIAPSPQSFPPDSEKALPQDNVIEIPHIGNFVMAKAGVDNSRLKPESPTGTPRVGYDNAALYVANPAASFDDDRRSVSSMLADYTFPRPPVQGPTITNAAALADHGPNYKSAYGDDFFVITLSEH